MKNMIYPCLWFNGVAKKAAEFYCSVFNNSIITSDNGLAVIFESSGQKFMCLNGGPEFTFNPSVSFFVICETEEETDKTWKALSEGGTELMPLDKYDWSTRYGWIQDRFGISWQLSLGRMEEVGQKFSPFLLFTGKQAGKAEQAVHYYTSLFGNSAIAGILKYTKGENEVEGTVKHAQFKLGDYVFMATDSSFQHQFGFNEAISIVVECGTQKEIDYFWENLTLGGQESRCGWLKDKFGISWQIVPAILGELMSDPSKSERVAHAFMQMKKFEIDKLVNA